MKVYISEVRLHGVDAGNTATLAVIRLPTSWSAALWGDDRNYRLIEQHAQTSTFNWPVLEDSAFLEHVAIVFFELEGIVFSFEGRTPASWASASSSSAIH